MSKRKQKAFMALYEPVHPQFERFCRARVYGQMEFRDLMNETLLLAFKKFDQLRAREAFLSWLFGIAVRVLANQARKKNEVEVVNEATLLHISGSRPTDSDAEVYLLHRALAQLPEAQKEAIILFEITGFSIKEIAVMQQASESAVKQRLSRGRQKLKALLDAPTNGKEARHG